MLSDWYFAAIEDPEKKKKEANCDSRADLGTLHVWYHHYDFIFTECVTAGSANMTDNSNQRLTK